MIDVTQIVVAIIGLLSAVLTGVLVPYIRTKLSLDQQKKLQMWISIGVSAAEQLSNTGVIQKKDRKQYVLDLLEKHGLTADLDLIDAMLEGAVYDLPSKITKTELKELTAAEVKKATEEAMAEESK